VALLENNIAQANQQLGTLTHESRTVGLEINEKETEYMIINPQLSEANQQLLINGKPIERVSNFKYLGSNMTSSAFDIRCRKGQAWSAFWSLDKIWRANHVHLSLKINIFKTAVLSVLLYGCETWVLTKHLEQELDGFGTNCLRFILGIKRIARVRNEAIYEQSKMAPVTRLVRARQLRYLGHVLRLNDNEPAKIFALYTPSHSKRKRGRPKQSFINYAASLISDEPKHHTRRRSPTWLRTEHYGGALLPELALFDF